MPPTVSGNRPLRKTRTAPTAGLGPISLYCPTVLPFCRELQSPRRMASSDLYALRGKLTTPQRPSSGSTRAPKRPDWRPDRLARHLEARVLVEWAMTELADIVAAIYGPEPRFRTLQITGTEGRDHTRLLAAFLRDVPAGAALLIGTSMVERPEERVDTWRAWVQPPGPDQSPVASRRSEARREALPWPGDHRAQCGQ
jgi:hypothetical protein